MNIDKLEKQLKNIKIGAAGGGGFLLLAIIAMISWKFLIGLIIFLTFWAVLIGAVWGGIFYFEKSGKYLELKKKIANNEGSYYYRESVKELKEFEAKYPRFAAFMQKLGAEKASNES